jgi:hypothetical protein
MKKRLRFIHVATCMAAAMLFGSACFAATSTPFLGAGSTGAFNAVAIGGSTPTFTVEITKITGSGTTATVTCATTCGFTAGQTNVSIVGTGTSTNPAFDATNVKVISDSGTTFTYASTDTTTFTGSAKAGITPTCGNLPNASSLAASTDVYLWSQSGKSGDQFLQGVDGRNTSLFVPQNAKAWVIWQTLNPDDSTSTATSACEYLAVDSIVGLRLFFATNAGGTPAGAISFPGGCASSIPGDDPSQVPLFPTADTALPPAVCSAINGLPFNVAPTDVRAEDGAFQVGRVCGTYAANATGYGLTCGRGGSTPTIIHSGIDGSTGEVQVVDFNIGGDDPISGAKIAHSTAGADGHPWVSINGGGQAVLILVNTDDTTDDGFGWPGSSTQRALANINRPDLERVYIGAATRTRDIMPGSGLGSKPLSALVREPLSGTYTTFENQVMRNAEFSNSADELTNSGNSQILFGVGMGAVTGWTFTTPTAASDQLAAKKTSTGGLKTRVIGTGEMISSLDTNGLTDINGNALTNQIGFAFFSFGNVKGAIGKAKYLNVDGTDPLFDGANGTNQNPGGEASGALPACSAPCPTGVTLTNIKNGSYPLWNIMRVVTTAALGSENSSGVCLTGASVCQLVQEMEASYSEIPDLVAISNMQAFRSHQTLTESASTPELGGDTYTGHNGFRHYPAITGTPCGFAPETGAAVSYECGGDAEGARFLIQQELDTNTDFSSEIVGIRQ